MDKFKQLYIALFLIGINTASFAFPDDRDQVLFLRAHSADINQENHKGIYQGSVELDQGSTHLRADEAVTNSDADNKLTLAIAKGNSQEQAHYWSQVAVGKPLIHAYADNIYYYPKKRIIELVGRAKVTQGKNTFSAPKIIYDIEKQHVITQRIGKQRTQITLYPEKKNE